MIVNFMRTYLLHKFQPVRFTGDLFEGKGIMSYLYVGGQGDSEVGEII